MLIIVIEVCIFLAGWYLGRAHTYEKLGWYNRAETMYRVGLTLTSLLLLFFIICLFL